MDIRRHLHRWLTNDAVASFDGCYEGNIVSVADERVRNRYTWVTSVEPVVLFADGWKWIPNLAARRALVGWFGYDTDNWVGRVVQVVLVNIDRTNAEGKAIVMRERRVACPDVNARVSAPLVVPRASADAPPALPLEDDVPVVEISDYDDSDRALNPPDRRKR
jgi:hypothetical protein